MSNAAPTDSNSRHIAEKKRLELIAALWSAFLAACFGSLVFFSQFDPPTLVHAASQLRLTDSLTGYALGFFFFWVVGAIGALLTLTLTRKNPINTETDASSSQQP